MALWQDLPGKNTRINRKNLSRLEMYTLATCTQNSDYKVDFDGANGLDNYDTVKIAFTEAIDNQEQARLSIDNGNTFYDIEILKGEEVENKEIDLIFKSGTWEKIQIDIEPTVVIDYLDSTSTTEALSANQGRVLKNKIDDIGTIIDTSNIVSLSMTNSWTNNASITLPPGTYILNGYTTSAGAQAGRGYTMRFNTHPNTRQSVYIVDNNLFSGLVSLSIKLTTTTTIYLQTWCSTNSSLTTCSIQATKLN